MDCLGYRFTAIDEQACEVRADEPLLGSQPSESVSMKYLFGPFYVTMSYFWQAREVPIEMVSLASLKRNLMPGISLIAAITFS